MYRYTGTSTPVSDYIAVPMERDTQGCLEMNVQNTLYYLFATHEKYKYIQCGIKKKGVKMFCDNMLKKENSSLYFPSFKNGGGIKKLVAGMPDD